MAQDIELKFDDDKDEPTQKLSVESDTNQDVSRSVNPGIENNQQIKIKQKPLTPPEKNAQNSTVEISDEKAYKTGVLVIGIPILLVLIIIGISTHKPSQQKESTKSKTKNEEVVIETNKADYTSEEEQTNNSITSEQGSGFNDGELYTVKPGETLYSIGLALNLDWKEIAEINGIEPPYDLKSGEELELPE